jgi:hypothetical protein
METSDPTGPDRPRLSIDIYQIADDSMFRKNRIDGTGWEWSWADWRREWMDETPNKFAYRCLPLTIANQTGWWVYNPVGFTAVWNGFPQPGGVQFIFDTAANVWSQWVNDQFGHGIITWNTPFLFRTQPAGSRLLVTGPINHFKGGVAPLGAIIESDWISMSWTMNYKITASRSAVRFDAGEPLFQVIPVSTNVCADLENARVTYRKLSDDPAAHKSYLEWSAGRNKFHEQKNRGEVQPDAWQKDYFQGRDPSGQSAGAPQHMTKVKPPRIEILGTAAKTWQE